MKRSFRSPAKAERHALSPMRPASAQEKAIAEASQGSHRDPAKRSRREEGGTRKQRELSASAGNDMMRTLGRRG